MTWLSGTSTLGAVGGLLTQLACGEVADGNSVTCASADQWVREIVGQDLIRTPASRDVSTGNVHNRAGYFALMSFYNPTGSNPNVVGFHKCVCQVTTAFSGVPTSGVSNNRWMMAVVAAVSNTTPGNYSTAQIHYAIADPDANTALSAATATLNAAGQATLTIGTRTVSIQLSDPSRTFVNCTIANGQNSIVSTDAAFTQADVGRIVTGTNLAIPVYITAVQDASHATLSATATGVSSGTYTIGGILPVGALWMRAFTSVYLGGIDWFGPFFARRSGNATFSVNPPGTVSTDYDLNVDIATPYANPTWNAFGPTSLAAYLHVYQGGLFSGVGYKTSVGLTGAQYTCSWNMALFKMRLVSVANGAWDMEWGGNGQVDAGTYRRIGGFRSLSWLKCVSTPGSASGTTAVQYWMSVKSNKIIIILNADPAATGTLGNAGVFSFTPIDYLGGSYDKFPMLVTQPPSQSTTTGWQNKWNQQWSYMQQKIRQDGSSGRDWQDFWMRSDVFGPAPAGSTMNGAVAADFAGVMYQGFAFDFNAATNGQINGGLGNGTTGAVHRAPIVYNVNAWEGSLASQNGPYGLPLNSDKPNPLTGAWRLYGLSVVDRPTDMTTSPSTGVQAFSSTPSYADDVPRGYIAGSVNSPWLYIPGNGWISGDELTDTVSGKKWFLCQHLPTNWCAMLGAAFSPQTYQGVASQVGGSAILEE